MIGPRLLPKTSYVVLALGFLACASAAFAVIFDQFSGCATGHAFAVITVVLTVVQAIISMLSVVNRGILTPCFMMAYAAFMCWYALLSSPDVECNASADVNLSDEKYTGIIVVSIISLVTLLFCVINGTLLMQIFMTNGQGVLETNYGASSISVPLKSGGGLDGVLTGEKEASAPPEAPHQRGESEEQTNQYMTPHPPDASGGPREEDVFPCIDDGGLMLWCYDIDQLGKDRWQP